MAGFSHVSGDLIITLDADLQNPPEEIPRLVAKADEGFDVVGTVRQKPTGQPVSQIGVKNH
ncbi:lipopolysaccharide modification protein [Salmonella enterica subsp. arizonae]|uniref:Lipopolysaccharide modification protein n=1 Tax=Salmonella enterica subsp. arizonae TaxID=59203 RepID=A0A447R192_SALER|nr:lipopolysaccharide modification protein [Salmonella enterica subsp. arizonae]